MIKVNDKTQPVTLFFNKLKYDVNGERPKCHLVLTGIGEEKHDMGVLEDLDYYEDFYVLQVDLSKLEDGEYKWCINDYEQGLMIIGDLKDYITSTDDVDTYIQDQVKIDNTQYIQFE